MVSDRGRNCYRPIHSYCQASRSRWRNPGFPGCRGRNPMCPQKGRRRVHRGEWWRTRRSSSEATAPRSAEIRRPKKSVKTAESTEGLRYRTSSEGLGSAVLCRVPGLQTGQSLFCGMPSRPLIIRLDADDIVLAEVASGLDLEELQQNLAGIFQPVHCADRDIDRFVLMHDVDEFVQR